MIEIRLTNGDWAEAEDPEAAVVAARCLLREASDTYYSRPEASFYVDGKLVRAGVRLQDLTTGRIAL